MRGDRLLLRIYDYEIIAVATYISSAPPIMHSVMKNALFINNAVHCQCKYTFSVSTLYPVATQGWCNWSGQSGFDLTNIFMIL